MKNQEKIQCEWMAKNTLLVNIDGQAYPCCYLANAFSVLEMYKGKLPDMTYGGYIYKSDGKIKNPYLYRKYLEYKDELNLNNNSLEDIVNHKWFKEILPESWENEDQTDKQCKKYCTAASDYYIKNKSISRADNETTE